MLKAGYCNVLIVDDEPLFRLALRTLLSESGLPFQIIGEASDGESALMYQQKSPVPELIFVDMKMPGMNGVEFMRQWKELAKPQENNPVMIALSAYQDYGFVREAFLEGALDYIVKVDMDQPHIIPILNKALELLEKRKQRPAAGINSEVSGKDTMIRSMLEHGTGNEEAQQKLLVDMGVILPEKDRVVAVVLTDYQQQKLDSVASAELIRTVLEQVLQSKQIGAEIVSYHVDEYVIVLHQTEVKSYMYLWNQLNELFTVVQRRLSNYANLTVTVGVSPTGSKPWKTLYEGASESASLRFFCGGGKLFFPDSRKAWEYENTSKVLKESELAEYTQAVLDALNNPDPDQWLKCLNAWSQHGVPAIKEQQVRKMFSDFVWKLGSFMLTKECQWEQLSDPYRNPFQFMEEGKTLEHMWSQLQLLMEAIHMKIHESPIQVKSLLYQAKSYIDHHYGDGITLTLVSNWVGVSESHLSKLFVKDAGVKFIDYLTRIRIQKAKDLMNTGMKLYEISESVGYPNPEHFSRVFKKEVGLSPAQYRDKMEQQK
ncbi:helix-turn-helix domain-containing protein [Paenibacillus sp. WQ 127069]|uniref:Helix-turn-helix domain-containing protein n=1 Tax=Paenibacillus baimaensis TaxID=2982185 RepID=A0ABT2UK24_9BACL|nr:helix-turn-helix domain-containing protein [Paenibacillus sp. WQ 127069]MCU6794963.1 helix-turn-helix domain-containing protein [Paenibacillus sp. WQ 127069]